ncbi:ArsR family transcriptional regulator, lead/cadmium/zinc/bismuth-responsive transcriptional repressor [Candidatus Hakubella thermalkaliphila]|uniref:ArsR family transcriptional regulator, lead/cadmium/zinc/bismuth-responsive transcriptional repressor n=1 Tax=Candidatus Hakubella thermalkaliphila TaxID=2754717 RepID=A0A6V8NNW1_9ACTN|nr:metalloregulator ArsR/SmtB family transcription factor [Candidatus Hakubella thermalkaliphila]MBT9171567.1 Transcriptional repressor SmtB [Actinomycetota bacterium]GFP20166.1 ArsR family transcriptional regulator, lead/cadmium/zinc/bismuth-responsive transcriptional repressor [Candidatus Hakubella thermalkaliphila]GFP23731.1 ArsR family transcriptional regulator, lead/cadmium/zinc/bismuth-responsive transcriptional repressor [Candidatus Hakubella thermalkaliphila]GFP31509.1 ArsR family trans
MREQKEKNNGDVCEIEFVDEAKVNAVKTVMKSNGIIKNLAETFKALGDPTRLKIIFALSREELCVCDLARLLSLSGSTVSHQLRILRNMRLAKYRKEGKMAYYSLDDEHIGSLFEEGLRHVEEK